MLDKKYKAFISYSHDDEVFGSWLHKELEKYKIPKRLHKDYPNLPKALYPIFRDRYELNSGDNLGEEITKALENSNALIVVCSKSSANSKWVNKEIIDFKMMYGEDNIFPIIIDGEPFAKESDKFEDSEECFPDALKYKIDNDGNLTDETTDILASSTIEKEDGRELAKLKLIAGILNIDFGEFHRRDLEQKRKDRNRNIVIWGVVFILMAGLTVFSWVQRDRAIENEKVANEKTELANQKTIEANNEKERAKQEELKAKKSEKKAIEQTKVATNEKHKAQRQLIIAKQKTQSLSILTTRTIEALTLSHEKVLDRYLKGIVNSSEREVFIEMLRPLIRDTESMDKEEKEYWTDILPSMNNEQVSKLVKILMVESQKLYDMQHNKKGKGYQAFYGAIRQFQKNAHVKCFDNKVPYQCLKAAHLRLAYSSSFDDNQSVEKYFKAYHKLVKKPKASYYDIYGQYLKKKGNRKKAFEYAQKAVSMNPDDTDNLRHLIEYYIEDKNTTKTLEIQKSIVILREKDYIKLNKKNITNQEVSSVEESRAYSSYISALNKLFNIQYEVNSTKIITELYPKYKKDIEVLENSNFQDISDLFDGYDDCLNIIYNVARSYGKEKHYKNSILFLERILKIYNNNMNNDNVKAFWIADKILPLTWYQLLLRDYNGAIKNSMKGIDLDINQAIILETNLAHAYLLSGDYENAKIIYLKNKDKKINNEKAWIDIIFEDFRTLRNEGIKSDSFNKIERLLMGFETETPKNPNKNTNNTYYISLLNSIKRVYTYETYDKYYNYIINYKQNTHIGDTYLDRSKFNDAISIDNHYFFTLLFNSLSLNIGEKYRIISEIPNLSQFQVDSLIEVFVEELNKFKENRKEKLFGDEIQELFNKSNKNIDILVKELYLDDLL